MADRSPLILTKVLLPKKRPDLLRRQRLVDFLHSYIERKLILVSASAGYGKTSLLIDYAHDTPLPVCWYSIDKADRDPQVFLEYLIASIQQRFPHFGEQSHLLAGGVFTGESDPIVGALVNEMVQSILGYFVLMLDDYHLVDDSEPINAILDRLLHYLPEHCHIILSSRSLPTKLTLTALTARQEIAGLGVNDLRFTAQEIQALVEQNYGTRLSDQEAKELAQESEGWIVGILLTRHTLWRGLFEGLIRTQEAEGQVFNYLANEVFAQQSEEVQHFLTRTSILGQMSPELCDRLLGINNSQAILELLERRNLFITRVDWPAPTGAPRLSTDAGQSVEGEEPWYRYHHLFQKFLDTRLRWEEAEQHAALHLQAAMLMETREVWGEAIRHYVEAGAYEQAAQTIERVAQETLELWCNYASRCTSPFNPRLIILQAAT
jgi:ATP/maltotriose-dependent transcriptional regulator MalT